MTYFIPKFSTVFSNTNYNYYGQSLKINHGVLIVKDLKSACLFYENELGLEPLPAFLFDYPTAFFKFND